MFSSRFAVSWMDDLEQPPGRAQRGKLNQYGRVKHVIILFLGEYDGLGRREWLSTARGAVWYTVHILF